jgi:hypothetical protein
LINNDLRILSSSEGPAFFFVEKGKNDVFWAAAIDGLMRIKIVDNKIITENIYTVNTLPRISADNCRVLFYDKSFNTLYVGTEGGGLNVISFDKNQFPDTIMVYKNNEQYSLSNNYVRSIIKDSNQNLWIGTYEGLNKMVSDSITGNINFKTYTKEDGLPNNMIQLIVEDDNHRLWIGTNGGLSQFIPGEDRFTNYTESSGLQSNEFSEHTAFIKPDGEIILGGINGINAFYPDQINLSSLKPKTTITGFYLFNEKVTTLKKIGKKVLLRKSITLTDTIVLLPNQKNIGFEFSAMIYPDGQEIRYAYMLEGYDNDWYYTDAGNRISSYTNLRHGKYTFKVKSTNPDGIWKGICSCSNSILLYLVCLWHLFFNYRFDFYIFFILLYYSL